MPGTDLLESEENQKFQKQKPR